VGSSLSPVTTAPSAQGFNLGTVFTTIAESNPTRDALVQGDRRWTYAELLDRSRKFANLLAAASLGAHVERADLANHESGQDHVALALYNSNAYLEGMIGSYLARCAPFNVNYRYVGDELRYLFNDAKPKVVLFHATLAPTMAEVMVDCPSVALWLQVADDSGNAVIDGATDYETALAGASTSQLAVVPSPDDLYILYTGGTTGMPKGVLWRQHDIYMNAMGGRKIGTWEEVTSYDDVRHNATNGFGLKVLLLPPLMHGAAQWTSFIMMGDGATLVLPTHTNHHDPVDILRTIERERINTFNTVGDAMVRPLLDELGRASYDTSSLLAIANGGAPLTAAMKDRMKATLPNVIISDSVGSSETGAQMFSNSSKGATQGQFIPGPGAVVISDDLTRLLEAGDPEIGWLAQSGWVPLGYLGDAAKTARTFPVIDGDRFAVPGDRARLLDSAEIELLGRDSVTINSGGEKIFAEEVEGALAGHPAIADVVVAGRDSERWGSEVVAVVAFKPGLSASFDELVEFAAQHIARYKLPKDVILTERVTRSPSGKADYRWAKEQATTGASIR